MGEETTTAERGDMVVYCLRLPSSDLEAIRKVAERQGTRPSTLLREWVQQRLEEEGGA